MDRMTERQKQKLVARWNGPMLVVMSLGMMATGIYALRIFREASWWAFLLYFLGCLVLLALSIRMWRWGHRP